MIAHKLRGSNVKRDIAQNNLCQGIRVLCHNMSNSSDATSPYKLCIAYGILYTMEYGTQSHVVHNPPTQAYVAAFR